MIKNTCLNSSLVIFRSPFLENRFISTLNFYWGVPFAMILTKTINFSQLIKLRPVLLFFMRENISIPNWVPSSSSIPKYSNNFFLPITWLLLSLSNSFLISSSSSAENLASAALGSSASNVGSSIRVGWSVSPSSKLPRSCPSGSFPLALIISWLTYRALYPASSDYRVACCCLGGPTNFPFLN